MTPSPQQTSQSSLIEWGISSFVPPGETESGDMHLVKAVHGGVLAALVDGVGHGTEAAAAARIAVSTLEANAAEGIIALMRLCHQRLKDTRGAVINLVTFDGGRDEMKWLGVGNVAGLLLRTRDGIAGGGRESIALRGGVVGYKLPPLHQATVLAIRPGDTVVLATDGINPDFTADAETETSPANMAERLCTKYATRRDDGMVMVVRYLGWKK
jgi:negative regulator of sigma-B (phosphoserine phosphatase)